MKNKKFLGIFLIGLVSASITGYLVSRGGGIADAGTTATLQGVRDGVATIAVTTQAGDTQVVRVREGETAKVGEAQISASGLTRGTLFRRGRANIELKTATDDIVVGPNPIGSNPSCNGVYDDTLNTNAFRYWDKKNNNDYHRYISVTSNSGQHYFLDFRPRSDTGNNRNETDVYNVVTGLNEATDKIAGDVVTIGNIQITIVEVYVNATDKYVDLEISGGYFSDSCTEGTGNTCLLNNLCGGTFIDLNSCSFEYGVQTTSNPTKSLDCGSGKVVLNHDATCNNLKERPSLSGYGYISPPTFPSAVSYTCVNATGTEILPDSVQGFCCGIKNL